MSIPKEQYCPAHQQCQLIKYCEVCLRPHPPPACPTYFYLEKARSCDGGSSNLEPNVGLPSTQGKKTKSSSGNGKKGLTSSKEKKSNNKKPSSPGPHQKQILRNTPSPKNKKNTSASSDSKINGSTQSISLGLSSGGSRSVNSTKATIPSNFSDFSKSSAKPSEMKIDHESAEQLKKDLNMIKEQLTFLTTSKCDALAITNELEQRYNHLLKKSEDQENEIECLKNENRKLLESLKDQMSVEGTNLKDMVAAKKCLEQYEEKLNELYNEFMDTSKIFQENKHQLCSCLKKSNDKSKSKSVRFSDSSSDSDEEADQPREDPNKLIKEKNEECAKLTKSYQKAKEENQQLKQTVETLHSQLNQALTNLKTSRQEAATAAQKQQLELNEKTKGYTYQLELKSQEICQLRSTVEELRNQVCQCSNVANCALEAQYQQLLDQYNQVSQKLQLYEENDKKRFKEVQVMKKNENDLIKQLTKLQEYVKELAKNGNDHSIAIAEFNSTLQEKESIIRCQQTELAAKDKQIDVLLQNEERLKRRAAQLQEDLMSAQRKSDESSSILLTTDDCSIHLTDELQALINALYEEIDKTLEKDAQIQQQNKNICCLQCSLSSKEEELGCIRKELSILREQLTSTLREKEAMVKRLKTIETKSTSSKQSQQLENPDCPKKSCYFEDICDEKKSETLQQLQNNVHVIKEQLSILIQNKQDSQTSENQINKPQNQPSKKCSCDGNLIQLQGILDLCESKLNHLCKEVEIKKRAQDLLNFGGKYNVRADELTNSTESACPKINNIQNKEPAVLCCKCRQRCDNAQCPEGMEPAASNYDAESHETISTLDKEEYGQSSCEQDGFCSKHNCGSVTNTRCFEEPVSVKSVPTVEMSGPMSKPCYSESYENLWEGVDKMITILDEIGDTPCSQTLAESCNKCPSAAANERIILIHASGNHKEILHYRTNQSLVATKPCNVNDDPEQIDTVERNHSKSFNALS